MSLDVRNPSGLNTMQHVRASIASGTLALTALALCACGQIDGGSSDESWELGTLASALIVPPSDASPPGGVVLGVAEASSGHSAVVSSGGASQEFALLSKTGPLNLFAVGVDAESGISSLSIWCNRTITSCDSQSCSTSGPGLPGAPCFASGGAPAAPGQEAPDYRILTPSLDLASQIPQGAPATGQTRTVRLGFHAEAVNSFGSRSSTPEARVVWSEAGPPPQPRDCTVNGCSGQRVCCDCDSVPRCTTQVECRAICRR